MAGRSRSVEFDLLVTGTETGGRKVERLGDKFDELGRKVERLDGKTAHVKGIAKIEKDSDALSDTLSKLGKNVLTTGAGVLKFASFAGLAAGAVGPLAVGLGIATAAAAHFIVEMSGAALALAPVAAGAIFVRETIKAMGEEFVAAAEPVTKAWEKSTKAASDLATKGLKPLAREFVKVNFPAVASAQERIGKALNTQLRGFVGWLNAAQGQEVIARLTEDTATAFESLAPAVREVGQSFTAMLGRISQVSFNHVTDGLVYLLGKLSLFFDRIDASDVDRGIGKLETTFAAAAKAFRTLGTAIDWVSAKKDKILALSDAILVLTAVGAALAGGWIVALGASLILLARHWDKVTAAVQSVTTWFRNLNQTSPSLVPTMDAIKEATGRVSDALRDVAERLGPKLEKFLDRLQDAWVRLQPAITGTVTVLGPVVAALIHLQGFVIGAVIDGLGLLIDAFSRVALAAANMATKVLDAFVAIIGPIARAAKQLHLPFADALSGIVDDARNASRRTKDSLNSVKTQQARDEVRRLQDRIASLRGKKVKTEADYRAIKQSMDQVAALKRRIASLQGKTITIKVSYVQTGASVGAILGGRAAGGPVQAGRPVIVGEHRPEVFVPPRGGGRIVPAVSGTRGMGGGTSRVVLEIRSGGSRLDDAVVEIVRRAVKVKGGGNVQVALGR